MRIKLPSDDGQKGFTLIELVAVLIILGVLAAVAIPSYMSMVDDAKTRAMEGALAEGMSTMSVAYAKLMFSNDGVATTAAVAAKATVNAPASDDFAYTFAGTGLVIVNGKAGSDFQGAPSVTKAWEKP